MTLLPSPEVLLYKLSNAEILTAKTTMGLIDLKPREIQYLIYLVRKDTQLNSTMTIGDVEIDLDGMNVRKNGQIIHMTQTELKVLAFLATNVGHVMTHMEIAEATGATRLKLHEAKALTKTYIGRIRKKLGEHPQEHSVIRTVRSVGYILDNTSDN